MFYNILFTYTIGKLSPRWGGHIILKGSKMYDKSISNKGLKFGSKRLCLACSRDYKPNAHLAMNGDLVGIDYVCPWCKHDNYRKGLRKTARLGK